MENTGIEVGTSLQWEVNIDGGGFVPPPLLGRGGDHGFIPSRRWHGWNLSSKIDKENVDVEIELFTVRLDTKSFKNEQWLGTNPRLLKCRETVLLG